MASAFDKLLNKETQPQSSPTQPRTLSGTPLGTQQKTGSAFDALIAETKTKKEPAPTVSPAPKNQTIYVQKKEPTGLQKKAEAYKSNFMSGEAPISKLGSNIEKLTQRPDEKDLGTSKWKNTLKYLPSTFIETLLPAVRAIRDDPVTASQITKGDLLRELPMAVINTAKEFAKAPIRGAIAPLPFDIKFNIPVLGEVSNAHFNTARRIKDGENPFLVALEESSVGILDTLFFASVASKPFQPRVQAPYARGVQKDPSTLGTGVVEGPKTGRLYTPDYGTVQPAPRSFADAIAKDPNTKLLRPYNPDLPTYFRVRSQNGQYIGELFQVKPSYVKTLFSKFGGDATNVPKSQTILLSEKTVSKQDFENGLTKPIIDGNELDLNTIVPPAPKVPMEPQNVQPEPVLPQKPVYSQESVAALSENPQAEETLSNILSQMEIAEAGKRVFIPQDRAGGTNRVEAVASTFPKYISEELRSRDLFDKVLGKVQSLSDIELPKNPSSREAQLMREIFAEIDRRLGTDVADKLERDLIRASTPVKAIQEKRLKEYEARVEEERIRREKMQEDFNIDDLVENFEVPAPKESKKTALQGMGVTEENVVSEVRNYIQNLTDNYELEGLDFEIVDIKVVGSRTAGLARDDSDLDVLIEFKGEAREDDLFNALNENKLNIDGVEVDINPIKEGRTGTMKEVYKTPEEFYNLKRTEPQPTIESLPELAKKFKTTVNIQDKDDIEYLSRILSDDAINDIKNGKLTNWRGQLYSDLARVNIISEKPLTIAQKLEGKIKDVSLKNKRFFHGTSADAASKILSQGFKTGAKLPEDAHRGGGYGKLQNSISLAETPKEASVFAELTRGGEVIEVELKDGSKVVSIEGVEDATDLEDFIPYLKKQGVDAVYIGGGEKELVIINLKAIKPVKSTEAAFLKNNEATAYTSPSSKASFGKFNDDVDIQMAGIDDIRPIELPELVRLTKELLGNLPSITKERVRPSLGGAPNGVFKVTATGKAITLNPEIFKDTAQATKTLAHELGHLIDYLPDETMARGNLLGRIASLRKYIAQTLTKSGERIDPKLAARIKRDIENDIRKSMSLTWDQFNTQKKTDIELRNRIDSEIYKVIEAEHGISNKQIRSELIDLTLAWKPFDPARVPESYLQYRFSPEELYADALSVLFNNPEMLKQVAPKFYDAFFEGLDNKPQVKNAYFDLQDFLRGGEEAVIAKRRENVHRMFKEGDMKAVDLENQRLANKKMTFKSALLELKTEFLDKNQKIIDRVRELEKKGEFINEDDDPRYFLEERNYLSGYVKAMLEEHIQPIRMSLNENGLTWEDFGEYVFYKRIVSGDRSEQANPQGITPEAAQKSMDALVEQYGGKKIKAVFEENSKRMSEYLLDINTKAYESGLYSDEMYQQMTENPAYVTFQVIDYIEQGMTSAVHKSIGTFKDITNPATASILKSIKVIQATERNNVTKSVVDLYKNYFPEEIKDADVRTYQMGDRIIKEPKESKLKDEELITYRVNGSPVGFYVDKYTKTAIENDSIGRNWAFVKFLKVMNDATFRPLFITYNSGFQSFNLIRDFVRVWKNSPTLSLADVAKGYYKALPVAKVRAFGVSEKPKDWELKALKDLQDMEKNRVVSITYNDLLNGLSDEDTQIDRIMEQYGIDYFTNTNDVRTNQIKRLPAPIFKILEFIKNTGDLIETLPKAAGYYEFTKGGQNPITKEQASFIRKNIGSPDFLAGGTVKPISNEVFLFSNAITQALRSDWHIMTSPKTRSSYWRKTFQVNFLPKILMYLAGAGVFGVTLQEMMDDVSEYDKTSYTIIPFGRDTNGKTVYLRLPTDESGRYLGGAFWKALSASQNEQSLMRDLMDIGAYTGGQLPSLTPSLSIMGDTFQFLSGNNPYDEFRGRQVLSEDVFKAGGWPATKAYLGWVFQQLGGSVFFSFYHEPSAPKDKGVVEKLVNLPVLGTVTNRFVRVSDYGSVERLRAVKERVEQSEARNRLDRKEAIYRAVEAALKDPDNKNEYKKKMTEELYDGGRPRSKKELEQYKDDLKKFETYFLRGTTNDANIEALYSATSNQQKIEMLKEIKSNMSDADFIDLRNFLLMNNIVSAEVVQQAIYGQ